MQLPPLSGGAAGPAIGGATAGGGGDWIVNFGGGNAGDAAQGWEKYLPWIVAAGVLVIAWRANRRR